MELENDITFLLNEIVPDPLLQGALAHQAYAGSKQWFEAIRNNLQPPEKERVCDETKPLGRIAKIVSKQYASHPNWHIPILTFNYDDLLEVAVHDRLEKMGLKSEEIVTSVSRDDQYAASINTSGIAIYHLHGYVRHPEDPPILDAASYVRVLGSPGRHWSWNCMTTYLLQRDTAALFLGLSLTDPSLRLLLSQHSAERGFPISGIYVSSPFPPFRSTASSTSDDVNRKLYLSYAAHDILRLFDEVLESLSLIPYHVSNWDEVDQLLEVIATWKTQESTAIRFSNAD